jgi:hypothetical protein
MKNFAKTLGGFVAGLALVAGIAYATVNPNSFYAGYNQQTTQNGINGLITSGGPVPTTTGSTCASGTVTAVGGASYGQLNTTTCTALTVVLKGAVSSLVVSQAPPPTSSTPYFGAGTNSSAPPNGAICESYDITHPADNTVSGAWNLGTFAYTTATVNGVSTDVNYTCTFAALTVTAADVILYKIVAY